MDKDTGTRLDYASQYASVANYWKNRAGTIESVNKTEPLQINKSRSKIPRMGK